MSDRPSLVSNPAILSTPPAPAGVRSAYLHIPFCRRRCFYCDFPVAVIGDRPMPGTIEGMDRYVTALIRELTITAELTSKTGSPPLETVFFGGGTPSLLPVEQLERILAALDLAFGFATNVEIAIEMDPGTFDFDRVTAYRSLGINRVSLGVQAFQDELLALCGRSHRTADTLEAVALLRRAGVGNLSLDLMSGLPHQSLQQWQESLEQAIALEPEHLSCYDLIVEAGTPFNKQYEPGERPLPTDEDAAAMYRLARECLGAAGFEHYEISNYARPGHQCRHNRTYWELQPFYGFGMGAASFWNRRRLTRPRTRQSYYDWVATWERSPAVLLQAAEIQSALDCLLEGLMLGLRLAEGVDLAVLGERYSEAVLPALTQAVYPYRECGWVEAVAPDGTCLAAAVPLSAARRLRLSDPEGMLFSNTVLAAAFAAFECAE
ncbi:MAG: radical SAM family heme chaperone HemW [Cyanobacteria bacterium J06641_5]